MRLKLLYLFITLLVVGCNNSSYNNISSLQSERSKGGGLVISLDGSMSKVRSSGTNLKTDVKLNQFISPGETIETDSVSNALLLLTNGTTLSLESNTKLELKVFYQDGFNAENEKVETLEEEASSSTILIDLNFGDLVVDVKKLKKKSSFEITTPLGVAGIRGTSFKLNASSDSTTLSVLTGQVNFNSPSMKIFEVKVNEAVLVPMNKKPELMPLTIDEKKNILQAVGKAREKANGVILSALSDRLTISKGRGEILEGWIGDGSWFVEKDGTLFLEPLEKSKTKNFRDDLWSAQSHDDFELSLDYNYESGDKAAVLFHIAEKESPSKFFRVPIGDTEEQGGLSWIVKPIKKATNGVGRWNRLFLRSKGRNIQIKLNGEKVVDVEIKPYPRRSRDNLLDAENQRIPRQDRNEKGWMAIANEGDPLRFRNLKITKLNN